MGIYNLNQIKLMYNQGLIITSSKYFLYLFVHHFTNKSLIKFQKIISFPHPHHTLLKRDPIHKSWCDVKSHHKTTSLIRHNVFEDDIRPLNSWKKKHTPHILNNLLINRKYTHTYLTRTRITHYIYPQYISR